MILFRKYNGIGGSKPNPCMPGLGQGFLHPDFIRICNDVGGIMQGFHSILFVRFYLDRISGLRNTKYDF